MLHITYGEIYIQKWKDEAIEDLSKVIELKPNVSGGAYYDRGIVYAKKHNLDQAIHDWSFVIEHHPDLQAAVQSYIDRGEAYRLKGLWEESIRDFETFLRLAKGAPNQAQVEKALTEVKKKLSKGN